MEKLINEIFSEYGYRVVTELDGHQVQYEMINQEKADYYICFFCESDEDLRELSKEVEAEFANETYYSNNNYNNARKKNTSIIFFVETQNIKEYAEVNQKLLYDIEESPYYLKKYVLIYSNEQVQEFKNYSEKETGSLKRNMERIISKVQDYKKSRAKETTPLFTLVLNLYAKIPFTSYDVEPILKTDELINSIDISINEKANELIRLLYEMGTSNEWDIDSLKSVATNIEISEEDINKYIQMQMSDTEEN